MSAAYPKGLVSVSAIAGPLTPTAQEINPTIGKGFNMGDNFYFHITPETARQWIGVLETIAAKESNA